MVWAFASLLALMALLAGLGASQVVRSRDRDDRLSSELRQARADLRTLREELEAIRTELTDVTGSLPPDVSDLLARVERSVVTVEATGRGIGSGFAIQADLPQGFGTAILTSEHVVRSALVDRRTLVAVTRGDRIFRARLGERDPRNDLVILYVRRELPTIPLASEEGHEPRVGDFVVAVGSQPGSGLSATVGVVSKLSDRVIQTDSAIEPGNLGGPLLNRYGEVLGVSTLSPAGSRGLGAAVRIDRACDELVRC